MDVRRLLSKSGLVVIVTALAVRATAGETELSGFIAAEVRAFPEAEAHAGQSGVRLNSSLVFRPELRYRWNDGKDRITTVPVFRLDAQDKERTHFDLREFNWLHVGQGWDLRVGVDKVFWGVTESRHLVDIINQDDLVEDIDGEGKLGQPMINLGWQREWGDINLFVMPRFRERTFPGLRGRLRGATPVDTEQAVFVGGASRGNVDLAMRHATVIGDWDIGVAYFHGVGREPRLIESTSSTGSAAFIPHYDIIDQPSLDVQATLGDWLGKLEAIGRFGQGDAFAAFAAGFEYTLYDVFDSNADLGVLGEYLYDGRDATAPATTLEDDVFLGLRLALNDVDDTAFLAGVIVDRLDGGSFFSLEADTRITDNWTVEAEARAFVGLADDDANFQLRRDHHVQIRVARYF